MKVTENVCYKQQVSDERDAPIRVVLPFKDLKSAYRGGKTPTRYPVSRKIDAVVQSVHTTGWSV